ncbi:MAG TPA: metallophosphoesterase [Patescibacteria group bacterium]
MKILIIGDIHIGESRESTSQPGIVRQANTQAEETLSALIPLFNTLHFDVVVHTGDSLSDTQVKETDAANITKTLDLLNKISVPKIHLVGNHELRAFSLNELTDVYKNAGIEPNFFGVQEFQDFRIIWLDMELNEDNHAFLPPERIEWLKSLPVNSKPTLVFSHYSLVPIDVSGTFYFEDQPQNMYLGNARAVVEALKHLNPQLCINGHVHLLTHQKLGDTHYISTPSFTENITAEKFPDNNPGIFSILDVDSNRFIFTTYSGEFCFSKIQGRL